MVHGYTWLDDNSVPNTAWQSRMEAEYYSITYFERITKFDVL